MTLLTAEAFYVLIGAVLATVSVRIARDRTHPKRVGSALFWALLATVFVLGKRLPPAAVGYMVLAMVALAGARQVERGTDAVADRAFRALEAARLGNRLFYVALLIPATALVGSLVLARVRVGRVTLIEPREATLIALGLGALVALAAALRVTGARPREALREGSRLLQTVGWALVLPQVLAALGGIFARAGVGPVVADLVTRALPARSPFVAVAAYCVGMALFTMCMGNAFAAFAVITGGIGLPLVVQMHHGNAAIMAAIGMLSGYCGTLMTPMAANFNIVPAMLLELPDRNAVVKTQVPIGLAVLAGNVAIMWLCVYRF